MGLGPEIASRYITTKGLSIMVVLGRGFKFKDIGRGLNLRSEPTPSSSSLTYTIYTGLWPGVCTKGWTQVPLKLKAQQDGVCRIIRNL